MGHKKLLIVEDQIPVTVVQPGDNVTIKCSGSIKERIHWFRQTPGHTMQFILQCRREAQCLFSAHFSPKTTQQSSVHSITKCSGSELDLRSSTLESCTTLQTTVVFTVCLKL
uniref:Immunoglobulin V-set domain-containing protein n=1 Tax=Neogobius melanostomus TaxID=47308 RepID=A0A8C6UNB1_9GOBI